jgi:hypothetical protein
MIEAAIRAYIDDDSAYHPVTNNCADFITDTANVADDVNLTNRTVPNDFIESLLKQYKLAKPPN